MGWDFPSVRRARQRHAAGQHIGDRDRLISDAPRLHQLVRVVPVGQVAEHDGVKLLALALEVYRASFVGTFQVQSLGERSALGGAADAERSRLGSVF